MGKSAAKRKLERAARDKSYPVALLATARCERLAPWRRRICYHYHYGR